MFDVALQSIRDTGGTALIMSGDRSEGALLPKLYAEPMIAGRGRLARRGERPTLVQVASFVAGEGDAEGASMAGAPAEAEPAVDADDAAGVYETTREVAPAPVPGASAPASAAPAPAAPSVDEPPLTRRRRGNRAP